MPVIKARTRGKHLIRHITRLDRESHETLFAYATFLGEPPEYVLSQLIDTFLAKDKEFLAWRDAHPGSHASRTAATRARARRHRVSGPDVVVDRTAHDSAPSSSLVG